MFSKLFSVFFVAATVAPAMAEGPLQSMAAHIPRHAEGEIYLVDIAAAARQLYGLHVADQAMVDIIPFSTANTPPSFDKSILALAPDGFTKELGFSVLSIDQMAGWGTLPEAPVVIRGDAFDASTIGAALQGRGFGTTEWAGTSVWHRQDDFEIDIARRLEEPFAGSLGTSERFALLGDTLRFTRSWPMMKTLLAGWPSILDDPDVAAILAAVYALERHGDVIDVTLLGSQTSGSDLAASLLGQAATPESLAAMKADLRGLGPGLPPYRRHALALWQRSTWMVGALLIPYPDNATAATARSVFTHRLETLESVVTQRSFNELLPKLRHFEVVETGGRAVLVLAFGDSVDVSKGANLLAFLKNPRQRLFDMVLRREIDLLIGGQ